MSLPSPNLDDRSFQQLLDASIVRIKTTCPQWNDLSPGDPGIVLLELFAFLTETMIYRLNRVPDKAYVEFLRLLGVKLLPPAAAGVRLRFSVKSPLAQAVEIPRGTHVTLARVAGGKELPIFTTVADARIPAGQTETFVMAHNAEWVQAERAGEKATGLPGLSVLAKRPPIIAPLGTGVDLIVGVEALAGEIDERAPALKHEDKIFRIWREVEAFTDLGADRFAYVADRTLGLISFAPSIFGATGNGTLAGQPEALAEIPPAGREICLWYLRGGGVEGDVGPNTLTVLKNPIAGVEVTNPESATGGSAVEPLANALVRGPMELHTLHRAVTARDFEVIALHYSGAVARAKAFTKAALWKYANAGTVELLLVPSFPRLAENGWRVTEAQLKEKETEDARQQILRILDERRPLGTVCLVNWVRYKTVRVKARIVCHREEKPDQVRERVVQRLHQMINPLPASADATGWRFGQSLGAFHVYEIILAEPGVKFVDQVRLLVDDVPDREITALAADATQDHVWYVASGERLFRSVNDGGGWEAARDFSGELPRVIRVHARLPGFVALSTTYASDKTGSRVWLSEDCGESWRQATQMAENLTIDDMAWITRPAGPALLLATDGGLYELPATPGGVPEQIIVDSEDRKRGFHAVSVCADVRGKDWVAVAARADEGVWLSSENGQSHSFKHIGLRGEAVRTLEAQEDGPRRFLWAGVRVGGFEEGKGCFRYDLVNPAEWVAFNRGWTGGSCRGLAFSGSQVLAATHSAGVLWTDATKDPATVSWEKPSVKCGLPLKEMDRFQPVTALAVDPASQVVLAGGAEGVYRSADRGQTYTGSSAREFVDKMTLPETWLFCSGDHDVESLSEDEANRH